MRDLNEAPWQLTFDGIEPFEDTLQQSVTIGPLDPDPMGSCLQFFRTADGPTRCYISLYDRCVEVELSPEAVAPLSTFFANAAL